MDVCENKRVVYLENVHLIFFPFLPCKQFHFHTLKMLIFGAADTHLVIN